MHLNQHTGPDGIYPRALKELAAKLLKPLSIMFNCSWRTGEAPGDWYRKNILIFSKREIIDQLAEHQFQVKFCI